MYPIQTVGSSCPTFLGKIRRRKKRECFHQFCATPDIHLSLFTMLSEPLRNICSLTLPFFDVTKFPRPPCLFKSKFHHLPGKIYISMKGSPNENSLLEKLEILFLTLAPRLLFLIRILSKHQENHFVCK